jgi:hypothetical protein
VTRGEPGERAARAKLAEALAKLDAERAAGAPVEEVASIAEWGVKHAEDALAASPGDEAARAGLARARGVLEELYAGLGHAGDVPTFLGAFQVKHALHVARQQVDALRTGLDAIRADVQETRHLTGHFAEPEIAVNRADLFARSLLGSFGPEPVALEMVDEAETLSADFEKMRNDTMKRIKDEDARRRGERMAWPPAQKLDVLVRVCRSATLEPRGICNDCVLARKEPIPGMLQAKRVVGCLYRDELIPLVGGGAHAALVALAGKQRPQVGMAVKADLTLAEEAARVRVAYDALAPGTDERAKVDAWVERTFAERALTPPPLF